MGAASRRKRARQQDGAAQSSLSVVVVSANQAAAVDAVLPALADLGDAEVVAVDRASNDTTLRVWRAAARVLSNLVLVAKRHDRGAARAADTGVAVARGQRIVLVELGYGSRM